MKYIAAAICFVAAGLAGRSGLLYVISDVAVPSIYAGTLLIALGFWEECSKRVYSFRFLTMWWEHEKEHLEQLNQKDEKNNPADSVTKSG